MKAALWAAAVLTLTSATLWSVPAQAQPASVCKPGYALKHQLFAELGRSYGESQQAIGLSLGGKDAIHVFANVAAPTWTIIEVQAEGCARIVAIGSVWIFTPAEPGYPTGLIPREDPS